MTDQNRFLEYISMLRASVSDRCLELGDGDETLAPVGFREEVFTAVVLEILEDLGHISDAEICYFDRRLGRAAGKINAWCLDEENATLHLVTTIYHGAEDPANITATELSQAGRRALNVFVEARGAYHAKMEPASAAFDMMQRIHDVCNEVERVRVVVIADGLAPEAGITPQTLDGHEVQTDVWDLRRLFRAAASGLPYESTDIDVTARLGSPLSCLPMPESGADYMSYLAIVPGSLLHSLYHEFGPRLLELNVRSFLQARGKVNRGLRDTLKDEPGRFLAYNNGISATAESLELVHGRDGALGISRLTGLQIVNGGQTVASIHRAKERDRIDLSDVFVQAKITIVRPEQIDTLVPLISRYANTQNRVNEADFSANHPFHVAIQQLSETTWVPGEQSRWFYERARGQYQVARAREGTTPARIRKFDQATPSRQRFDKVMLAKFLNSWDQLPHIVSRGGQKNFVYFMERLARLHKDGWTPDAQFYRDLVAKAIIFKHAEKIARMHAFSGYRANAITYTVALVSYRTAGRVDLSAIWNGQEAQQALADTMYDWMPAVYQGIIESAGSRNVTEWAKKEDCWRHIQTLEVTVPAALEKELAAGQPLPTVGDAAGRRGLDLTSDDREHIARVMQISAEEWLHFCAWGSKTGHLHDWQMGIANTLAGYAAMGWSKVPSRKQAAQGVEILRIADEHDGRLIEV